MDAAFDTKSVNTRNADRDKDLRSDLFFDVAKFPKMTFKSKRAEPGAAGHLKLIGDLTIKGVTKEVTLEVEGPTAGNQGHLGRAPARRDGDDDASIDASSGWSTTACSKAAARSSATRSP